MVFEYGFDALELDEIRVRPIETNAAMRGIMERKFGFDGITSLVNQTLDQAVQGQEETTRAWGCTTGSGGAVLKTHVRSDWGGSAGGGSVLLRPQTGMEVVDE